jgi:hypothetical protein
MGASWQLQEAKNKPSEVIDPAFRSWQTRVVAPRSKDGSIST